MNLPLPDGTFIVCLFFHLYFGSKTDLYFMYLHMWKSRIINRYRSFKNALIWQIRILRPRVVIWLYGHILSMTELEPELTSQDLPVIIETSTYLPRASVKFNKQWLSNLCKQTWFYFIILYLYLFQLYWDVTDTTLYKFVHNCATFCKPVCWFDTLLYHKMIATIALAHHLCAIFSWWGYLRSTLSNFQVYNTIF